jgi:hypothetical protein
MELHKIKRPVHSKKVFKLKRQPTEWDKIFASYTSDRELITRIYKELTELPQNQWSNEEMSKITEWSFFKGRGLNGYLWISNLCSQLNDCVCFKENWKCLKNGNHYFKRFYLPGEIWNLRTKYNYFNFFSTLHNSLHLIARILMTLQFSLVSHTFNPYLISSLTSL